MMTVEIFKAEHFREIRVQAAQLRDGEAFYADGETYAELGTAYTLRWHGRIVACAGVVVSSFGPHLWAVIAENAPFVALHRAAQRFIGMFDHALTAEVKASFAPGCRWLEMLGFERAESYEGLYRYVRQPCGQ